MMINAAIYEKSTPRIGVRGTSIIIDIGTVVITMSRIEWETIKTLTDKTVEAFLVGQKKAL